MTLLRLFRFKILLLGIALISYEAQAEEPIIHSELDSLNILLDQGLDKRERLNVLHSACKIFYKLDKNYERLIEYAEEGMEIAREVDDIKMGADLAVWILRANIYLRSYDRNPPYYAYLKELYLEGKIEKKKYIQPLYSEIYSYIDYGKLKEAEEKMGELESLIDTNDSKQQVYYLDLYIAFKRKAKENRDASLALSKFALESQQIDDPRFAVIAYSRNAEFYLEDSINYRKSREYALDALAVVEDNELHQYRQPILLQLSKAYYKLQDRASFIKTYNQISLDSISANDHILLKDYNTFSGDLEFDNKNFDGAIKHYKQAVQYLETSDFASMELLTRKIERCYVKMKDYSSAHKYANRLNVLQDSLYTDENMKAIKVFESRLRSKDAENERIKLENRIQAQKKSTMYIGFFSSLLLLSLLFYNRILDEKVKIRTATLDLKNKELKSSLEELEQFNYIASHDIKEPMRVVSSVTGLIEKKMAPEQRNVFKGEFKLVKNSISQLYTLIEDLSQFLDFKSGSFTPEVTSTGDVMDQVSQMLARVAKEKNAVINYDSLPNIYSCPSLLTVIFKNLVENGIKYNESEQPRIDVGYAINNGRHEFKIRDNGIGIDEKYHGYIFQMFKRLQHRDKKGSGLGLGLVSKAAEKLGGDITVNSAEGKGSTFTVSLPQSYIVSSDN